MYKKLVGTALLCVLLLTAGCGSSLIKSYVRKNASLGSIRTVGVLPFEGGQSAPRIRDFATTQLLTSKLFDVVDEGRLDSLLAEEGIAKGAPLDAATLKRLGQHLKVQAFLLGSVKESNETRGSASFPEVTMTLRLIDTETGTLLWQASGRGTGYSLGDRLFGLTPKDSFIVTMNLLRDLFATIH
jgi:TolB-like protein